MNIHNREMQLASAMLTYQPANLLNLPSSVEVTDPWGNGGAGIGSGSNALRAAMGEFYERQHFYMDVVPDFIGSLDHSLGELETSKFIQAFTQTKTPQITQRSLISHQYNLSQVIRASDLSLCHIPTACIALSTTRTETENFIYPLRDTCGCAFGWHPEQAIFGSIKEFLERQFLIRFWLTGTCIKIIDAPTVPSKLAGSRVETLGKALMMSGELSFIDISDVAYPGICVLAVYGQSNTEQNVRYCAGMAYAATLEQAMEKSLLELWQTFRFIDVFVATEQTNESIHDSYLKYFLQCNHYQTYREITSLHTQSQAPSSPPIEPLCLSSLLGCLTKHKALGYIYLKMVPIENQFGFCSKFISPDFFMHMNNAQNVNLENFYSRSFLHAIQPDRKKQMVPFP
jgi:hypothetical protein